MFQNVICNFVDCDEWPFLCDCCFLIWKTGREKVVPKWNRIEKDNFAFIVTEQC